MKYNLFFVPCSEDRKKISALRSRICKKVHSTQALQYPVHLSLISEGFEVRDYLEFEQALRQLCVHEKPHQLRTEKFTAVLPNRFWTGIHIVQTKGVTEFQKKLQKLRNKFAQKKEKYKPNPLHITLAFPAKVDGLNSFISPVDSLIFDRITIVRKEKELAPYRIFKHIKLA